jgi:hypothetical protein
MGDNNNDTQQQDDVRGQEDVLNDDPFASLQSMIAQLNDEPRERQQQQQQEESCIKNMNNNYKDVFVEEEMELVDKPVRDLHPSHPEAQQQDKNKKFLSQESSSQYPEDDGKKSNSTEERVETAADRVKPSPSPEETDFYVHNDHWPTSDEDEEEEGRKDVHNKDRETNRQTLGPRKRSRSTGTTERNLNSSHTAKVDKKRRSSSSSPKRNNNKTRKKESATSNKFNSTLFSPRAPLGTLSPSRSNPDASVSTQKVATQKYITPSTEVKHVKSVVGLR